MASNDPCGFCFKVTNTTPTSEYLEVKKYIHFYLGLNIGKNKSKGT